MESVKASIGGNGMVVTRLTTSNIGSDHNNTNTNAANHRGDSVSVLELCAALCVCEWELCILDRHCISANFPSSCF